MQRFTLYTFSLLVALSLLLSPCQPAATPTAEPVTLKMALLPIIDTLPMYVAEQEGLFAKHGVQVEFVPVAAAPERDQLIAAGQADGMINETLSTFFFNKEATQVQIVRYSLVPTAESRRAGGASTGTAGSGCRRWRAGPGSYSRTTSWGG